MRFLNFFRNPLSRRRRWFIGGTLSVVLIFGTLCIGTPFFLEQFLESSKLRELVSRKAARELKAPTGFLPLEWHGFSVRSSVALARRDGGKGLQEMRASDLSARCNLMEMWHGKWRIEKLTIDHLQAAFGKHAKTRLIDDLSAQPTLDPPAEKESPLSLAIQETLIRRTALWWGDEPKATGGFSDVETQYFVDGKNLSIHGQNGMFQQTGWPEAKVGSFRLYYAKPHLRIDEGTLSLGGKSVIAVQGGLDFGENASMDVRLDFKQCPVARFLKPEWQKKFVAVFRASTQLRQQFGKSGSLAATGDLQVSSGELKSLQALDQLAAFTGKPQLRELSIDRLEGTYDWNSPKLKVTAFRFESKGVVSVRGEFTIEKDSIQGEFRVGAAPDLVEKFPGAREEVFTSAEGNYLWTTVNISGPLKKPRQDLKPRLVGAAQKHFAKGFLAPILKPGGNVIEAIDRLFDTSAF